MSWPSRLVRFGACTLSVIALTACASMDGMKVNSYAERGVDISRYRTYQFARMGSFATGDPRLDNNRFFHERMQADVETQLAAKGFARTKSARPDLLVRYHARVSQQVEVHDYGYDYMTGSARYTCDRDGCRPYIYDAGTLWIELVDPRSNKVVWGGWAEGSMDGVIDNQPWMEERIDAAVRRILEKLPQRL